MQSELLELNEVNEPPTTSRLVCPRHPVLGWIVARVHSPNMPSNLPSPESPSQTFQEHFQE